MSKFKWFSITIPALQIACLMGGLLLITRVLAVSPLACLDKTEPQKTVVEIVASDDSLHCDGNYGIAGTGTSVNEGTM